MSPAPKIGQLVPVVATMVGISVVVVYFSARPWITVDPIEAVRHS